MKNVKKIASVVLAGAMVLSLAACGSKDKSYKKADKIEAITAEEFKAALKEIGVEEFDAYSDEYIDYTDDDITIYYMVTDEAVDVDAAKDMADDLKDQADEYDMDLDIYIGDNCVYTVTSAEGRTMANFEVENIEITVGWAEDTEDVAYAFLDAIGYPKP